MKMARALFVVLVGMLLASCLAIQPPTNEFRKKLQGPPSEFEKMRIPDPDIGMLNTESAWYEVKFEKAEDGSYVWKGEMVVDSNVELDVSLFSPYEDNTDIIVHPPNELPLSVNVALATSALWAERAARGIGIEYEPPFTKRSGPYGIDGASYPVTTYTFDKPAAGTWGATLIIRGVEISTEETVAMIRVTNKASARLYSHLNRFELEVGQEVGLIASLHKPDADFTQGRPEALRLASHENVMSVIMPDGRQIQVPMYDDGVHAHDELADDGIYVAVIEALMPGHYIARSVFRGVTVDGLAFERTNLHSFHVIDPYIALTGLAEVSYDETTKYFNFNLDVDNYDVETDEVAVKAYAEVWGTDSTGYEYAPIAWVQAMVDPYVSKSGDHVITLQLHEDWVHNAGVSAPFQLRNAWLQDRNWNVILSQRETIFVDSGKTMRMFELDQRKLASVDLSTEEMTWGPRPVSMMRSNFTDAPGSGKIVLVHGYCAGMNEFPPEQFTNAVQFQDFKQSRTTDAFALKLRDFGNQFPSFSLVGHSHGGLASTHLHTYYWSNLENSANGRLIQSVGSPYYGSGIAGDLALIGVIFGLGCGKNNDLTYDGAAKWAGAIPASSAKDVYYYTSQYNDALLGGYCVWGASLALYAPNDGTTEVAKAQLANANYAGHKKGWCHTNGMNHPNQCADKVRNAEMNAKSAR